MEPTEQTVRFWDGIAERYSKRPFPNPEATRRKLEITKARMRPTDVVLDLGCATATITLELAPHAARMIGIELSDEMLAIARRKASEAKVANVELVHAGAAAGLARFEPGSVDGVCAYNVLHLLPDWRDVLRTIHQVLKPGGFFISSTPCLGDSWIPMRPMLAVMRALGKAPAVELVRADELLQAMRDAGFVDLARPDVGGSGMAAFIVGNRPGG